LTTLATANFNDMLPAAPTGRKNVKWQADPATANPRNISAWAQNIGGVDPRTTTSETIGAASSGMLVTLSNSGAIAVSLDSTVPADFLCWFDVTGAGGATLTPTAGATINGAANLPLAAGANGILFWTGSTWWALLGPSVSGLATQAGVQAESYTYAVDTGAANAYAVSLSPAPASYAAGLEVVFNAAHANTGASTLNVNALGAKTIKKWSGGSLADLTSGDISAGQIMSVKYDGTYFQVVSGGGGGSSFTAGGDLSGTSSSQEVVGILNKAIDGSAPTDGQILQYSSSTGKWEMLVDRPIFPVSMVVGKPSAGQLVCIYTAGASMTFPANFASPNSYGSVGTLPSATATFSIYKNGSLVGNVAVSTAGVFTFTTTSGSFSLNAGDRLTVVAPGSQDATMADVGITLVGTRTATVPAVLSQGIFTWRSAYNGATAYSVNDVVSYTAAGVTQSYVCISPTTGNPPTNATYWNLLASAGSSGTTTSNQIQQEAFVYAADAGSANAYSAMLSPAPNVVDGSVCVFRAAHANTGASTLTLPGDTGATGGTAQSLVKQGGTALASGDISANQVLIAVWDNAHTKWELVGGGGGGDTTAKYIVGDSVVPGDLTNAKRWPGLYASPDIPPVSANAMDDEFDSVSGLWTTANFGSCTEAVSNSWLGITAPSNGGAHNLRYKYQAAPATPWEFTAKLSLHTAFSANYSFNGLIAIESATSKAATNLIGAAGTAGQVTVFSSMWSNLTTQNGSSIIGTNPGMPIAYLKIKSDGTTLYFSYSFDGVNFVQYDTRTIASYFTVKPDRVGIVTTPYNLATVLGCDWFRRTI
jgi:hypothetical protein